MSKDMISKNYVFSKKGNQLEFIGDFDGLYENDDNPWGQNGEDKRLGEYYNYSRKNIVNILNQYPSFGTELLEIGCGLGYVVEYFNQNTKYNCIGADISNIAIKKARQNFKSYDFHCFDITQHDLEINQQYNVVILNQLLWYLLENLDNVFENISKILSPDGYLIVVNAFTDEQNYGKDIIDGFGGLITYIENNYLNYFDMKLASLYAEDNLMYKDGLILLKKKSKV